LGLPTTSLTLREVIDRLLVNSLDVKIERLNLAVADDQTRAAAGKFDPFYYFNGSYTDSRLPLNALELAQVGGVLVPGAGPNLFRQQNSILEMGFAGRIPLGTQFSLFTYAARYRNDLNRIRPPALYYPEYAAAAGISLVQPLLRDFGKDVQMAEIRVTRRNRAIADYKWETVLQRSLSDVILDYLDLTLVMENIALKREVLGYARRLADDVNKRVAEGKPSDMAPQDANWSISVAEEDVIKAMTIAADRQVKLKTQIMREGAEDSGSVLLARDPLRMMSVRMDRPALVQTALQRRPDYLATMEEVGKTEILVRYMANQRLPRLDLQTTLTTNGLSDSANSAYERAGNRQGYEAQVGFRFSVPLGNDTARANCASAEHLHQQALLNKARSELGVTVEISSLIARVKGSAARLNTVRKSLRLAKETEVILQERATQGTAGFGDLLRARVQLIDARTRELEALLEYNRSAVQLTLASGLLLEKFGIQLDRGNPQPAAAVKVTKRG
jgi:outer membrane protein TolC